MDSTAQIKDHSSPAETPQPRSDLCVTHPNQHQTSTHLRPPGPQFEKPCHRLYHVCGITLTVGRLHILLQFAIELQLRHKPGTHFSELWRCSTTSHRCLKRSLLQEWPLVSANTHIHIFLSSLIDYVCFLRWSWVILHFFCYLGECELTQRRCKSAISNRSQLWYLVYLLHLKVKNSPILTSSARILEQSMDLMFL